MKLKSQQDLDLMCGWIEKGLPTGSRIIGGSDLESDFDYVRTYADTDNFIKNFGFKLPEFSEQYAHCLRIFSYRYRRDLNDNWLNLIIVEDAEDLNAWGYATAKTMLYDRRFEREHRKIYFGKMLDEYYFAAGYSERAVHNNLNSLNEKAK